MTYSHAIPLSLALMITATPLQAAQHNLQIHYTKINECQETVANQNAAFSELKCKAIGAQEVRINQVGADYFGISLARGAQKITADFSAFPGVKPEGKVIEWHSRAAVPVFMVFRISYDEGATRKEVLTLSRVTENSICPLASVDTQKNPNANQRVRDLMNDQFAGESGCPAEILKR